MRKAKIFSILSVILLLASCNPSNLNSSIPDSSFFSSREEISSETETSSEIISSSIEKGQTWVKKEIPVFNGNKEAKTYLTTYFLNGIKNIPYVSVNDILLIDIPESVDILEGNGQLSYKNYATGGELIFDYASNTVTFSDYYAVFGNVDFPCYICSEVDPDYFQQKSISYGSDSGSTEKKINLSDYHIQMALYQDQILLPAATAYSLVDIFSRISYNGYAYFINRNVYNDQGQLTEHGAFFKEVPSDFVYDETLRSYTYNQLCLSLDFYYGMKDLRGYGSFDSFFIDNGIKERFFKGEPDSSIVDSLMSMIFNGLLNDNGHTYTLSRETSFFRQTPLSSDEITYSQAQEHNYDVYKAISNKKEELEIDEPWMIKDDTMFINLDDFSWFNSDDDDQYILDDKETSCSIIKVANDYIQDHDDEIKNVVINLTTDGGGEDMAELYTSSWIQSKAYQYAIGPIANYAKEVGEYVADVNMDGVYDEKDNISDKKVYLLTSNYTFSNGNVLTGELKGKENVTIIGQKTGGGSCNTLAYVGVLGNLYHLSSLTRATNANWESLEDGVDPDIALDDPLDTCDYDSLLENYIGK